MGDQPVNPPTPPLNQAPVQPSPPNSNAKTVLFAVVSALLLLGGLGGGYLYANSTIKPVSKTVTTASMPTMPDITVPRGATVIAECAKGRGKQYVLPKDIPTGPVYNVYQGKVIGLEYMVGKNDLLNLSKSFNNLPMLNGVYDHINIGLLSTGHAGFPEPHYHVDVFLVPNSVAAGITCEAPSMSPMASSSAMPMK